MPGKEYGKGSIKRDLRSLYTQRHLGAKTMKPKRRPGCTFKETLLLGM